ncbi:hypothetical protein FCULG_00000737, partial [Fusarium culmorum]
LIPSLKSDSFSRGITTIIDTIHENNGLDRLPSCKGMQMEGKCRTVTVNRMSLRRLLHVHGRGVPRGPSSWDLIDAVKFRSARHQPSCWAAGPAVSLPAPAKPVASTGVDDLELFRDPWRPG